MSEFAPVKEEEKKLAAGGEDAEGEDGGDDGPAPEEECAATFAPVVKLEAIEVKTHEEDEDVLYSECVSSCFCRNPWNKISQSLSPTLFQLTGVPSCSHTLRRCLTGARESSNGTRKASGMSSSSSASRLALWRPLPL
jgi:hypothetical protein